MVCVPQTTVREFTTNSTHVGQVNNQQIYNSSKMKTKRIAFIVIISIISIVLIHHYTTTNDFYEDTSDDFGLCKIPLINPHGLLSQTCKGKWYYNFDYPIGSNYVDSIAVVDSMIIWNNISGTEARGYVEEYHWFIFDTKKHNNNMYFLTKNDLDIYLQKIYEGRVYFYAPQDVWRSYWDNDKKWIMLQGGAKGNR